MGIDADLEYCYLTTTGRVSGEPREIEIWFGLRGSTVYLLSGGGERSDWVRNLLVEPRVTLRLGGEAYRGTARVVRDADEDRMARSLVHGKYASGPGDIARWRDESVVVAIDLEA